MNYCRKLGFAEDPDYRYMIGLFEGCMKKNGHDPKVPDFIWNKNRLVLEKEALKQNMMKVINMPNKTGEGPEPKKIDKNSLAINQANAILNKRKEEDTKKDHSKPTQLAGQNIISGGTKMQQYGDANAGSQQAQVAHQDQSKGTYGEKRF
mmetsp:Transcript_43202/g.41546  ORF Transcript_43202/g.41546 Transcript_43202/m.41546 type:complete len:150 (+) Transcript_43202:794-1243(+)